jgi:hypothetical protein
MNHQRWKAQNIYLKKKINKITKSSKSFLLRFWCVYHQYGRGQSCSGGIYTPVLRQSKIKYKVSFFFFSSFTFKNIKKIDPNP